VLRRPLRKRKTAAPRGDRDRPDGGSVERGIGWRINLKAAFWTINCLCVSNRPSEGGCIGWRFGHAIVFLPGLFLSV